MIHSNNQANANVFTLFSSTLWSIDILLMLSKVLATHIISCRTFTHFGALCNYSIHLFIDPLYVQVHCWTSVSESSAANAVGFIATAAPRCALPYARVSCAGATWRRCGPVDVACALCWRTWEIGKNTVAVVNGTHQWCGEVFDTATHSPTCRRPARIGQMLAIAIIAMSSRATDLYA